MLDRIRNLNHTLEHNPVAEAAIGAAFFGFLLFVVPVILVAFIGS